MSAATGAKRGLTTLQLGKIFVALALVAAALLFQKAQLSAALRSGSTIEIQFSEAHRLRGAVSDVKMSGVEIGVVRSVERDGDLTRVKVKVDDEILATMGTAPSARIRPATLLGGNYYVEIVPGGQNGTFSGAIPADRTRLPVELDGIASAFPANARQGVKTSTQNLDATLDKRGKEALRKLLDSAPQTLTSTEQVLLGLQGTVPDEDLGALVSAGENATRVMADPSVELDRMVGDLATTTSVLSARRNELAAVSRSMPETLSQTTIMLDRLDGTLDSLERTAGPARPAVRELAKLLNNADPVLAEARPVVKDLRVVLQDARPLVDDLIPISRDLDATVHNLHGPVLERVNGPILGQLMTPWHGTGMYAGGGADRPLYKETAYMFANLAQANMMDPNGSMIAFLPAVSPGSLSGLPFSLENILTGNLPKGANR